MNYKKALATAVVALTASVSSLAANSLTFQGVTFSTYAVDSDTLNLTIDNATSATGDWVGVNFLKAFALKNIGTFTSATMVSGPSFATVVDNTSELTANGCTGGSSGGACFTFSPAAALTSSMSWTIDFTAAANTTLDFSLPHLKIEFYKNLNDSKKTGSLLSQDLTVVTAVPEPESYALMLAGLGLMATIARRRKAKQA
jgi:hypothetical protein